MNDQILGTLTEDDCFQGVLEGVVVYEDTEVALHIDPDGGDLSNSLPLARAVVSAIVRVDKKAREVAVNALLKSYNENWRKYREADEKGGFKDVSNPEIDASEFAAKLTLTSVSISSHESCCLGYDDGDLFAGHTIFVTSFDGIEFSNAHATLFG